MLNKAAVAAIIMLVTDRDARSQPRPVAEYLVVLKSGAVYRGEILELEPGRQVTIRAVRGEVKTFPWTLVDSARSVSDNGAPPDETRAATPQSVKPRVSLQPTPPNERQPADSARHVATPPTMLAASASPTMAALKADAISLRLQSPVENIALQGLVGTVEMEADPNWGGLPIAGVGRVWQKICNYPCKQSVPRNGTYRVVGEDISTSQPFRLPRAADGELLLRVRPGTVGTRAGAWVLVALGGLAAAAGVGLISVWASAPSRVDNRLLTAGGLTFGAGFALALASIPVFLQSRTRVERVRPAAPRDPGPAVVPTEGVSEPD